MLAADWNPWSLFFMLDYFSRAYFVGVICIVLLGYATFLRILARIRSGNQRGEKSAENTNLNLEGLHRNLYSLQSFAMVLTSGCCANQIFAVWFTYMARVTDANPFFALKEAWTVSQILICLIISLDALRRYASAVLERDRPLLSV
jgi:hypothetical protein